MTISALRASIANLTDGTIASKALFAVAQRAVVRRDAAGPWSSALWASELVETAGLGHDLAWRQQLARRAAAVQYEDVKRILVEELAPNGATWLIAGPEQAVRDVYALLGLTSMSLLPD